MSDRHRVATVDLAPEAVDDIIKTGFGVTSYRRTLVGLKPLNIPRVGQLAGYRRTLVGLKRVGED